MSGTIENRGVGGRTWKATKLRELELKADIVGVIQTSIT